MKHLLTLIALALAFQFTNAQEKQKAYDEDISTLNSFSNKTGTLLIQEFYPVGKVGNIEIKILVLTDLLEGKKEKGLHFVRKVTSTYGTDQNGYIDEDEIADLIKSFSLVEETVNKGIPDRYTELIFKTKSKFSFGSFISSSGKNPEWKYFIEVNSYSKDANQFLTLAQYNLLSGYIIEAHEKIQEL